MLLNPLHDNLPTLSTDVPLVPRARDASLTGSRLPCVPVWTTHCITSLFMLSAGNHPTPELRSCTCSQSCPFRSTGPAPFSLHHAVPPIGSSHDGRRPYSSGTRPVGRAPLYFDATMGDLKLREPRRQLRQENSENSDADVKRLAEKVYSCEIIFKRYIVK